MEVLLVKLFRHKGISMFPFSNCMKLFLVERAKKVTQNGQKSEKKVAKPLVFKAQSVHAYTHTCMLGKS